MGIGSRCKEMCLLSSAYLRSFKPESSNAAANAAPIDFVVTWVDGNDPAWQEERFRYLGTTENDPHNGSCRYRDWNSFRYWFRAVETFAPWVRYVFLVTWGHVPQWLNLESPKLKIVKHTDFIPEEYLPTYNSLPIELNLFRIPELSENFVYFNDDVLLARPAKREDFFVNGKPCHTAIAFPWINRDNGIAYHQFFYTYGAINRKNDIHACIRQHPEKWFSHVYGSAVRYNRNAYRDYALPGMRFTHMGVPFCKSTMAKTWEKYREECDYSSRCKLRDFRQITHQVYSIEDILSGNFVPSKDDWGKCIAIDDFDGIHNAYRSQAVKMICLFDRDDLTSAQVKEINEHMTCLFERMLPSVSTFEVSL